MFCPNCGSVIPDNSQFCPICGANIVELLAPMKEQAPTSNQPEQKNDYSYGQPSQPSNQYSDAAPGQGYAPQNDYTPVQPIVQPAQQSDQPAAPPKEKKSVNWGGFYNNYFYTAFILIGFAAFICNQLAQAFITVNLFFFVLFTIFEYPLMFAFLALGIVRLVVGIKTRAKQENPTKEKARDILIFGISVIAFVFFFIATILTFVSRANYNEAYEYLQGLFS